MKILGLHYARYRLPLTRRFAGGGVDVRERRGLLVRMDGEDGQSGYGEIAPLPGLHRESLAQAASLLEDLGPLLLSAEWSSVAGATRAIAEALVQSRHEAAHAYPSVIFGLEMAAVGLLARASDTTPAALLGTTGRSVVPINALFRGSAAEAEEAASSGRLRPYPAVKVKIGQQAEAEDRSVLQRLHAHLPEPTLLRIDGNRSLTPKELTARLGALPAARVDYLEEPLADPTRLAALSQETGMRIGLDESLRDESLRELTEADCVNAWILKPSTIGSWERTSILAERGARGGKAIVISSALESGLGLWHLAQMAAALPGAETPAGLGTEVWLAEDLLTPRYDASRGEVAIADWRGAPSASIQATLDWRTLP